MSKIPKTTRSTEVDPKAADEMIELAKSSKSSKDRAIWLDAYERYRFTRAKRKKWQKLALIARLFRRLTPAM